MFPLPRVAAAMASDRLIWPRLAERSDFTQGPLFGTIFLGACTSLLALVCPLQLLVEMMSIGTLMAYTMVSLCVLLLRYRPTDSMSKYELSGVDMTAQMFGALGTNSTGNPFLTNTRANVNGGRGSIDAQHGRQMSRDDDDEEEEEEFVGATGVGAYGSVPLPYQYGGGSSGKRSPLRDLFEKFMACFFPYGWKLPGQPTEESSWRVLKLTGGYLTTCILLDLMLAYAEISVDRHFLCTALVALFGIALFTLFTIARQPQNK